MTRLNAQSLSINRYFLFFLASVVGIYDATGSQIDKRGAQSVETPPAEQQAGTFDPAESAGLFVGVRQTDDLSFSEVPYAADDAVDLAYLFSLDLGLIPPERITLLLKGSPQKPSSRVNLQRLIARGSRRLEPTQAEIYRQIRQQGARAGPNGLLVVSLAMHGAHRDGIDFLVATDTVPGLIPQTGLEARELFSIISESDSPRRLVLVDACRERLSIARSNGKEPSSAMSASLRQEMAKAEGQVVLMGTTVGGYSFDDPHQRNGVFTAAILRGLKGAAPGESSGWITIRSLAQYVDREVRRWVQEHRPWLSRQSRGITREGDLFGERLPLASAKEFEAPATTPPSFPPVGRDLRQDPGQRRDDLNPEWAPAPELGRFKGIWLLSGASTPQPTSPEVRSLASLFLQEVSKAINEDLCLTLKRASAKVRTSDPSFNEWETITLGDSSPSPGYLQALETFAAKGSILIEITDRSSAEELQIALYARQKNGDLVRDSISFLGPSRFSEASDLETTVKQLFQNFCKLQEHGYNSYFALIDAEVRDGPGIWGPKQIGAVRAKDLVRVLRIQDDSDYWEIAASNNQTGFVHQSVLGGPRSLMREPLSLEELSHIPLEDLWGLWVTSSGTRRSEYGQIQESITVRAFYDSPQQYNGQLSGLRRHGGRLSSGDPLPLSWNTSSDGRQIWIESWTDITEKGHRMKWDFGYKVRHWEPKKGELSLESTLLGASIRSVVTWHRCDNVQDEKLRKACNQHQRIEFDS